MFFAIRSVYARLLYPLGDPSTGDSKLTDTTLLDSYTEQPGGQPIKYDGKDNATKGELVIETTLGSVKKFHVIAPATGADKIKAYKSIRNRVETFLFPSSGRASWDQILDAAGSRGLMVWAEPGTLDRMKDVLLTAGEWRDQAGQVMKPPFEEVTAVSIEYTRDAKTGAIATTDIKLFHGDTLYVAEDTAKGVLFPYLSRVRAGDRATEFKQRCQQLGIQGVTLHSYRYAWAERAKTVG